MSEAIPQKRGRWIAAAVIVVAFGAVAWFATRPQPEMLQGQVEVRKVNVATKIAGRIDSLLVREGDIVQAGQLVVVLRSPELDAKEQQTEGLLAAAQAQELKSQHGARAQEIAAAEANWQRALEAERLAATTIGRVENLFNEGVVAAQRRDEAQTQLSAARLTTRAAKAQYDLAVAGARFEDKAAAKGVVRQAQGGRAEVRAYQAEMRVTAPISGEVSQRTVEPGEIVSAGLPIITIADLHDAWVTFNLREDRLGGIGMGSVLHVVIPALGGREIAVRVSYISPVGDYATWRSTGEAGGFDLRTFEVRARPTAAVAGLRPGMTVLLRGDKLGKASTVVAHKP